MVRSGQDDSGAGPRFVLTGTFHGLNRGDSAMQLVAARTIRERWPGARVTLHLSCPEDDQDLYADYETLQSSRREPGRALSAIIGACFHRIAGSTVLFTPELRSLLEADMVVDLSGDGLTETFGWRCPVSHTIPLLLARILRRPYCLMGQTIGPFRRVGRWVRWIVDRAAFVTARDDETYALLSDWKLAAPVEKTADLAFLLEPAPRAGAIDYIKELGEFDESRPLVGITPSNLHNIRSSSARGSRVEQTLRLLVDGIRPFIRDIGGQALIIPHVFGPGDEYDDRIAAANLAGLLEMAVPTLTVKDPLPPAELKAVIGCCEVFVGMRMHSVIASTSQCIPTIALAYSSKHHGLMSRLQMPQFAFGLAGLSPDRLRKALTRLWQDREAIRENMSRMLETSILPSVRANLSFLAQYLSVPAVACQTNKKRKTRPCGKQVTVQPPKDENKT